MNTISIGSKIREYRIKKGLNLEKCAELSGITRRYLSDIENGAKTPKLETFVNIVNAVSGSADYILQDDLVTGYKAKSNMILKKLDNLDEEKKKIALEIFDNIILTLENH